MSTFKPKTNTVLGKIRANLKAAVTHLNNAEKMLRPQDGIASRVLADERIREAWLANQAQVRTEMQRHNLDVPEAFWKPLDSQERHLSVVKSNDIG